MAKSWSEVQSSAVYQALDDQAKQAAKDQYFTSVVAPKVPKNKLDIARSQFFSEPEPKMNPTEGMSGMDTFLAGTGKAFVDLSRGVGQRLGMVSDEDIKESRRLDAPLMNTTGGKIGNLAGNIAALAPTMMIPGANTVAGAGLLGAASGFLSPSENGSETAQNVLLGGMGSGAVAGALRAAPAIKQAFIDPFTSKGAQKIAARVVLGAAKDPDAVRRVVPNDFVPGSTRTLAETTKDSGLAQLQRNAQANSADVANALADNRASRNLAREKLIQSISGDPAKRDALVAARDEKAQKLYGAAFQEKIDINSLSSKLKSDMQALMRRPSVQSAMKDAKKLALEEGIQLGPDGSVVGLHYLKKALDNQIDKLVGSNQPKLAAALNATKEKLVDFLGNVSPNYKAALQAYAIDSKPINKMDVGQAFSKTLFPSSTKYGVDYAQTPAKFFNALEDANKVAKSATGLKGASVETIFTPQELRALEGVGADVGSQVWVDGVAKVPGSPTAQYLAGGNAMRSIMGPLGLPKSWSESVLSKTLGSRPISALLAPSEENAQRYLADILSDPVKARAAFELLKQGRIGPIAAKAVAPVSIGASRNPGKE